MDYTLHRVPDPTSDGAAHPWLVGSLNVAALCEQELFGHTDFVPTLRRTLSDHRGSSSWVSTTWVAVTGEGADPEADDVPGYVRADLSLRENLTKAFMDGGVRPDLRRQGMATALLERATADLAADGRTTQVIYAVSPDATGHPDALPSPVGAGAVDGRMPNARLLLARGFTLEQYEHASTLTLTDAALEHALELAREAATHAAGYELVSWADRCPDDLIDGMADLHRHMSTDIPQAGLEFEAEVWDAARLRIAEDRFAESRTRTVWTAARHLDSDELVAFTGVEWDEGREQGVQQGDTLVRADHRGHRLGMLVKTANLRRLREDNPRAERIHTWNAAENGPMLDINRALGFRPTTGVGAWRRVLETGAPIDSEPLA